MEEFKTKTSEEISKLSEEENAKYFAELIDWQTKSINDLKAASDDENKTSEEIAEIKKQLETITTANIVSMKTSLETQGIELAKLMKEVESKTSNLPLTMKSAIYKELEDNKEALRDALKSSSGHLTLNVKASQGAADINAGTDFADMESGVGQIATRQTFMRNLFQTVPTVKEYVKYNDQETIVRDAKNVAACAATTHNSKVTWKVRTLQITKVRDFVDVCIDMMDDYDFVSGEIRELVTTDVALQVDSQLLLSDGIYPNTNSVASVASTMAAGSYALSVQAPTTVDVLKVAAAQISDFGQNNKFNANVAVMNPVDATLMMLEKDVNNNYLIPNFVTGNGVNIGPLTVITNQLVPADQAYVFDTTKGRIYQRKGVTVDFGFENNDNFEKEIVTVKAYERLNLRIKNVDANAFMHIASISAIKTAITKP